MRTQRPYSLSLLSAILIIAFFLVHAFLHSVTCTDFSIHEATVVDIQRALSEKKLTSRQLVDFYLDQIETLNPKLHGVLEVNPDARDQADAADREREETGCSRGRLGTLHGIPVLLKDSIATDDKLNTTVGSFALLGSVVPRDAGVVERLRKAGAVILGKASLSEWYHIRSMKIPDGWSARGGQGANPYVKGGATGGSSSGSAISVAANMAAVSLGTETDSSILCPADFNSVVGLKPTVGLTSRAGVVPVSPRQDTIGPMCRTVSDAVHVLDAIVGFDRRDYEATKAAAEFIPAGGYTQFLRKDGLQGKRLGVVRNPFSHSYTNTSAIQIFERHIALLREKGATVVDNLEIANIDEIMDFSHNGELFALLAEFKVGINEYLDELIESPVRSLADVIAFNKNNSKLEMMEEYDQEALLAAEQTNGIDETVMQAVNNLRRLSELGFEKLMRDHKLDAMVTLGSGAATVLAKGGYPGISVPAGYKSNGMPFGVLFGGLLGAEPKLIEIAYAFEQATMARRPPPFPIGATTLYSSM